MRLTLVLLFVAATCVVAQKSVWVFDLAIQADNTAKEIKAQTSDIKAEIKSVICKGAAKVDGPFEVKDKSGTFDSQTTSSWKCYTTSRTDAKTVATNWQKTCNNKNTFKKLNDELEDSTSAAGGGEIELEKLFCYNTSPAV